MFLNTNYIKAEQTKSLFSTINISYTRNDLDNGKYRTANNKNFDFAQLHTQITQHNLLALIVMMKSFRLAGGKIKCERLIKNNRLTYSISIKGNFFAEIDCEYRAINRIADKFINFDTNEKEKCKDEIIEIANFIKKNVFIDNKPDNTEQLISPLNEEKDFSKWLEYINENHQSNRFITIPKQIKQKDKISYKKIKKKN